MAPPKRDAKKPQQTPDDDLPEERAAGGMLDEAGYQKIAEAEAKKKAAETAREIAENDGEAPIVANERLKALKEEARRKIEEALVAKRKRRRLLRGGDVSR